MIILCSSISLKFSHLPPSPRFFQLHSDVNSMYLSSTEPPAAAEWACLLRPLRGREPEGIWNLLSIVREMFKRRDTNAAPLLEILTDQCLTYEQVLISFVKYILTETCVGWNGHIAYLEILRKVKN